MLLTRNERNKTIPSISNTNFVLERSSQMQNCILTFRQKRSSTFPSRSLRVSVVLVPQHTRDTSLSLSE